MVKTFGESDAMYLSDGGFRSLRPHTNNGEAQVSDVGTPVDSIVTAKLKTMTADQITDAPGMVDPVDGRFMGALNETIFVFTFFYDEKITSWTKYEYDLTVEWWAVNNKRTYIRADDTLYLLGGDNDDEYADEDSVVVLSYVDGRRLGNWKQWAGMSIAVEGVWDVYYNTDPNQPNTYEKLATVDRHLINELADAMAAWGPVIKLKFVHNRGEYAKIGAITLFYELEVEQV
jgi:hypothetical protein